MDIAGQRPIPFLLDTAGEYLVTSTIVLTLYDYMLLFDDEIRYVWKGRKTWIFYLYTVNRVLLLGFQFWQIYHISTSDNSKDLLVVGSYFQFFVVMFFLFSSDVFVTLRVCAISLRNKLLVVFFATLALARFVMALMTAFLAGPRNLQFKLIPNTIGTIFDISAILTVVWYTYRNKGSLKFSALARVIMTEATIYFVVMLAAQIYIQISFNLIKGQQLPLLAYGLFNPILTLRFAISLRKSADPEGGREWQLTHFNTPHFARPYSPGSKGPAVRESVEMNLVSSLRGRASV